MKYSGRFSIERTIMLYQFRTKAEALTLADRIPNCVLNQLCDVAGILDSCYNSHGIDGGYILLAENIHDVEDIRRIHVDYSTEPVENVKKLNDYLSILYLPATEYSITVVLPESIAPEEMKGDEALCSTARTAT